MCKYLDQGKCVYYANKFAEEQRKKGYLYYQINSNTAPYCPILNLTYKDNIKCPLNKKEV